LNCTYCTIDKLNEGNSQRIKPYTFAIATANAQAKIAKEYVFANAISRTEKKAQTANKELS